MANDYIIKIEGSWPSGETEYVIGTEDLQRLPVVSSDDNGDVLTVVDGKWSDAAPGGGGSGLPPVTSDDNGDVLTVVEGEWAKAAPTGGASALVIRLTDDEGEYVADKTYLDVISATEANVPIFVIYHDENNDDDVRMPASVDWGEDFADVYASYIYSVGYPDQGVSIITAYHFYIEMYDGGAEVLAQKVIASINATVEALPTGK